MQQFRVLKCYSCEAFQVHQVKKSKYWNCKVCGEKQSVIKVFGCGSGVDCRRHVQKLNSRRGEILEDLDQTAWSLWENREQESKVTELGEEAQQHNYHPLGDAQVSRWTKYLQNPGDDPSLEENGEEENVSMERNPNPACRTIRKRKRGGRTTEDRVTSQDDWRTAGGKVILLRTHTHNTHQALFTQTASRPRTFPRSSSTAEGSFKTSSSCRPAPCRPAPAPCRPAPAPCRPAPAPCRPAPARTNPLPGCPTSPLPLLATSQRSLNPAVPHRPGPGSFQPVCSADAAVSKTSRWAQFLSRPSPEEQEEQEEEEEEEEEEFLSQHVGRDAAPVQDWTRAPATLPGCAGSSPQHASSSPQPASSSSLGHSSSSQHTSFSLGHWSSLQPASSSFQPASSSPQPASSSPQPACSSLCLPADDVFLGGSVGWSFSRLRSTVSLCGFGDVPHRDQGPAPVALHQTVCHQPPPTKRPRPSLPVTSLFNTDEDFEDEFEL